MEKTYILFFLGIFFLAIGFWQAKKDKTDLIQMEQRLEKKEKRLFELYEAVEGIIQDMLAVNKIGNLNIAPDAFGISQKNNTEEYTNGTASYNLHKQIILMNKDGYTEEEIAKQLGMGKGEIRLILGLKNIRG
jgi:hypothetical protein